MRFNYSLSDSHQIPVEDGPEFVPLIGAPAKECFMKAFKEDNAHLII
jgi:hypothetical protein